MYGRAGYATTTYAGLRSTSGAVTTYTDSIAGHIGHATVGFIDEARDVFGDIAHGTPGLLDHEDT